MTAFLVVNEIGLHLFLVELIYLTLYLWEMEQP
jgi:hypothetical protein